MDLTRVETPDVPDNSTIARLARIIAERLDPDNEYDCDVSITTAPKDDMYNHSASDIPTGGYEFLYADYGLEITIDFVDNADCPSMPLSNLVRDYSDALDLEHGLQYKSSFNGADGHNYILVFPVLDKEFTCGVTDPSWA